MKLVEFENKDVGVKKAVDLISQNIDEIKGISMIVEYKDGSSCVYHSHKTSSQIAFDSILMTRYAMGFLEELENE